MAKNTLPEDFKDDILAESMNGRRRYQMISNADGTVSFVDVTEYSQVGSNFGQAQINATNVAVNESADKNKIIDSKEDLLANTQAGMMAGALAVKEIRSELNEKIDSSICISNELQTITLPFTAQNNVMMQIKIAHILDDIGHYCYLKSNFYGNNYYSFVGASRGGMTSEWFPVKKGDTISFQGASGVSAITYAVFL